MESGDLASEVSSVLDEDEEQADPVSICSGKSSERLIHETRRRRGLLALGVVALACVSLVGFSALRGRALFAPTDKSETSVLDEKKLNVSARVGEEVHVAEVEESAVVSLAEVLPREVVAPSLAKAESLEESSTVPGSTAVAPWLAKAESLESSDMPGVAAMESNAEALKSSDFPGAGDSKEKALAASNMPGIAEATASTREDSAKQGHKDSKAQALLSPSGGASLGLKEAEVEGSTRSGSSGTGLSWMAASDLQAADVLMKATV